MLQRRKLSWRFCHGIYFSVSIDDLLSGEKLLSIAEKENKANIRTICDFLFGMVDVCSFMLILLPLYPNTVEGFVYSVNLLAFMLLLIKGGLLLKYIK